MFDRRGDNHPGDERRLIAEQAAELIDRHWRSRRSRPVTPTLGEDALEKWLAAYDFSSPQPLEQIVADCAELLSEGIVSTTHPRYFGLFNPASTFAGVVADTLVAAFNPQLAVESHAPGPVAVERRVLAYFARRLGVPGAAGTFTSGGAEANHTAVLVALQRHFPEAGEHGLAATGAGPTLYASREAHDTLGKIAHATGLGRDAVRVIETDSRLRMDADALLDRVTADRADGRRPFLVVATAGTTATGAIDPLDAIADVCRDERLDLHVDAAWAGALCLSKRLSPLLAGIERADSITVDAHKWLSVPMGAGMIFVRDRAALAGAFRGATGYMPSAEEGDPYLMGMQWSRRFIGLKVFMSLAVAGADGYAAVLERDCRLGVSLRARLRSDGWLLVNDTPLPVVCFRDPHPDGPDPATVAARVVGSGAAWISTVWIAGSPALRACITNYDTTEADLDMLCAALRKARGGAAGAS